MLLPGDSVGLNFLTFLTFQQRELALTVPPFRVRLSECAPLLRPRSQRFSHRRSSPFWLLPKLPRQPVVRGRREEPFRILFSEGNRRYTPCRDKSRCGPSVGQILLPR